jgi:tripartite-type tricarboxylate transporter receptor subunit TctC
VHFVYLTLCSSLQTIANNGGPLLFTPVKTAPSIQLKGLPGPRSRRSESTKTPQRSGILPQGLRKNIPFPFPFPCLHPLEGNTMRRWLKLIAVFTAGLTGGLLASSALSQTVQAYPNKPVRIIVPFAAGSATDIVARLLAEELRGALDQNFIVDDRPGASARIGAEAVAKAAPDGYTLLVTTNTSHSANPHLFKKLNYDPIKDFAPIGGIMNIPVIVVVNPKLPVNSLKELIDYAKARPGKVSFGYGSSIGQVTGTAFAKAAGIDVIATPYKSSPQAMTDLLGEQIDFAVTDMAAGQALVNTGKLKALAVSTERRSSLMPDLPTMAETPALAGFELVAWVAVFAPAGTPGEIVNRLSAEVRKALAKPEVRDRIASFAAEVTPSNPEQLAVFVKSQLVSWGKRIKDAGIEPE